MGFKDLFEVGPGSEFGEPDGGSAGEFVSFIRKVFVDGLELIVLFLHAAHSDDGAVEHFLEHFDVVFEEFEFGGLFYFVDIGLFFEFVVGDRLFEGVDFVLIHEFSLMEEFEVMIEDGNSVELFIEFVFEAGVLLLEEDELGVLVLGGVGLVVIEFEGQFGNEGLLLVDEVL